MLTQKLTLISGDSKVLDVTVTNDDGTIFDLTGASITWVLAIKRSASSVLVTKVSTDVNKILINSPTEGKFKVLIHPADTSDLRGVYWHECQVTDQFNNVNTVFGGEVQILDDVITT